MFPEVTFDLAVTKSGTGTWGLGGGTLGRGHVETFGRGDLGTWGRGDSGTWDASTRRDSRTWDVGQISPDICAEFGKYNYRRSMKGNISWRVCQQTSSWWFPASMVRPRPFYRESSGYRIVSTQGSINRRGQPWRTFPVSNCVFLSILGHPCHILPNRPFYSCELGDLAFEWQRG